MRAQWSAVVFAQRVKEQCAIPLYSLRRGVSNARIPCGEVHIEFKFEDWAFDDTSAGDTVDDVLVRTFFPQQCFLRAPALLDGYTPHD